MEQIVTAQEMARIESLAYEHGASDLQFMENAGLQIAEKVEAYIAQHQLQKNILIIVGRGNNGGDALVAGQRLIKEGFHCIAWLLYPDKECSELCQKQLNDYRKLKGEIIPYDPQELVVPKVSAILDGIVGTGFHGKTEGIMFDMIEQVNCSGIPILAVDIPSGLNGTTGEVGGNAIRAAQTIYLGCPKLGFFIGQGWNYVGDLVHADFGMDKSISSQGNPFGFLSAKRKRHRSFPPLLEIGTNIKRAMCSQSAAAKRCRAHFF